MKTRYLSMNISPEVVEEYFKLRDCLVESIEAYTGSLLSMPYHEISTEDLQKLLQAVSR